MGGGEDRTKAGRFFDYSSHEGISAGISHGTRHANTRFPSTTFELRLPLDRRQGDSRIERGIHPPRSFLSLDFLQ